MISILQNLNEEFDSDVEMKDVEHDYITAVIKFKDESIPSINYTIYLADPELDKDKPMSSVYVIKNEKGVYKIRFQSLSEKKIQNQGVDVIINNNN